MALFVTRFAPSPSGALHLGHAFSALYAFKRAQISSGIFRLRIEDIDQQRAQTRWVHQIKEDLQWLGISWPEPVLFQSAHSARYHKAIKYLADMGLVYPCRCSRRDIRVALSAPHFDENLSQHTAYPGTCRGRDYTHHTAEDALRLNMQKALDLVKGRLSFTEKGHKHKNIYVIDSSDLMASGDIVLSRRIDGVIAYALCSVVDDAYEGITEVIRGEDLFAFTPVQILLQKLLKFKTPLYNHHRLICDQTGKRLAKRNDACAIMTLREQGATPEDIRKMVAPIG